VDTLEIIRATTEDVDRIAPLFDAYREFYKAESDLEGSTKFIRERLELAESVIFLAMVDGRAVGFVQLFPMFAPVQLKRLWILNDLYVDESARKGGVGHALMQRAEEHARETGARGLYLRTATDNLPAQSLYESCGWVRDTKFYRYDKRVG
jgi:GNAT superfamily N-acetyltransferase